ncbi:hypothetical protein DMENIID0001_052670 [Sergentomyia squamirostris]
MKPNGFHRRLGRLLFLAFSFLTLVSTTESSSANTERKGNATLVLLQDETNVTDVKLQFDEFRKIFHIENEAVNSVQFMHGNGLSALMKYLENNNYSVIIFVLSNNNTRDAGYCDMAEQLSVTFSKDVIFWPCPRMKRTGKFLPSFEILSYVVKSISQELNWTEAVIFATETNWGLPLAISANIHIPFRIEIGTSNLQERQIADKKGKVVIITSSLNSIETQQVIQHFEHYKLTKLFLIDMFGTIFNSGSQFYTYLSGKFAKIENIFLTWSSGLVPDALDLGESAHTNASIKMSGSTTPYKNLLVLTVLTEKLKYLLNKTLHVEFEKYSKRMLKQPSNDEQLSDFTRSLITVKRGRRNLAIRKTSNSTNYYDKDSVNSTRKENSRVSDDKGRERNSSSTEEEIGDGLVSEVNAVVLTFLRKLIAFDCDVHALLDNLSTMSSEWVERRDTSVEEEQCLKIIDCRPHFHVGDGEFCKFFCRLAFNYGHKSEDSTKSMMRNSISESSDVRNTIQSTCFNVKDQKMNVEERSKAEQYLVNAVKLAFVAKSSGNGAKRWRRQATRDDRHPPPTPIPQLDHLVYSEFFSLFDFIVSIMYGANESGIKFDFIVLDLHQNVNVKNESTFGWHPFLILQQNHINHQVFTTHPLLRGFRDWGLDTSEFWTCGTLCWGVIGLAIFLLMCIIVASVAAGIAVRNYLLKKRLSKGPNKIVLSPSDFVFPVDSRRVDEGIEAMLCCWLQQLQEFGGPEVDKPDLLKGSIGSLKNLGLATAAKNNSGSGSLAKHHTVIDVRARYNGDLVQLKEIPLMTVTELKTKAMDILMTAHGLRHENINPLIGKCDNF